MPGARCPLVGVGRRFPERRILAWIFHLSIGISTLRQFSGRRAAFFGFGGGSGRNTPLPQRAGAGRLAMNLAVSRTPTPGTDSAFEPAARTGRGGGPDGPGGIRSDAPRSRPARRV